MDKNVSSTAFAEQGQPDSAAFFKLGYRPELDGLRGISILLVFIHHFYYSIMPGGFLGVDIFFVLSGFLITSLLMQEWQQEGRIHLLNFYVRRFLRLMPAVVFVSLILGFYALIFLSGEKARRTFQGILLTLSYASNWLYAFKFVSVHNPLSVTWSLAIEEQFYLIFPVILLLILKSKLKKRAILFLFALLVGCIAFYRGLLWEQGVVFTRLYYASDTRADALLVGCFVGLLTSWNLLPSENKNFKVYLRLLAAVGFIFLCYLIATVEWSNPMLYSHGGYTLVALAVGVIIVLIVFHPPKLILSLLRSTPLVWVGQVSYGLYLWHWVVHYFVYEKQNTPSSISQLTLAIVLSLLFTVISYYCVEMPFLRLKKRFNFQHSKQSSAETQ